MTPFGRFTSTCAPALNGGNSRPSTSRNSNRLVPSAPKWIAVSRISIESSVVVCIGRGTLVGVRSSILRPYHANAVDLACGTEAGIAFDAIKVDDQRDA